MPDTPDRTWIGYDQARFFYLPYFTGRGRPWVEAVTKKLHSYDPEICILENWESEEEELRLFAGDLLLTVDSSGDATLGLLSKAELEPDWGWDDIRTDSRMITGLLPHVKSMLEDTRSIKDTYKLSARIIHNVVQLLSNVFDRLDLALSMGHCKIMARPNSPISEFKEITSDQWRYFAVEQQSEDSAHGPAGERLYSVFVVPASSRQPGHTSVNSERQCNEWLHGEMLRSPAKAPHPRSHYESEARRRWPSLSERAFDRAWKQAISRSGAANWSKGGRPTKGSR